MQSRWGAAPIVAMALAATPVVTAVAQEGPAPDPAALEALEALVAPVEITLTPGVWIPRLLGDVRLGQGPLSFDIDVDTQLDLREREPSMNIELELRKRGEPWHLHFDGYDFEVDTTSTFVGNADFGSLRLRHGDLFSARVEIFSFAGEVGYVMIDAFPDDPRVDFRLGPVFALRYVDVDQTVEQIGVGAESPGGDWLGAMAGVHFDLIHKLDEGFPLLRKVAVQANAAVGPALGGEGGVMYHLRAGVHLYVTDALAFHFGFRLLEVQAESNDQYELTGGLQGLFLGGSITF